MKRLQPFFSYYGGKHRMVSRYTSPQYPYLVEPFAGSAAYACLHYHLKVILYDLDPVVAGLWNYLIRVRESEILSLPLEKPDDLSQATICQEAKWLIGFWYGRALSKPVVKYRNTVWARQNNKNGQFWGEKSRFKIASQLKYIRHWKCFNKSWTDVPDRTATWLVDPPYQGPAGRSYRCHDIDYPALAEFCQTRKGQVIVTESINATWLPFMPVLMMKGLPKSSTKDDAVKNRASGEAVWERSDFVGGLGKGGHRLTARV